MPGVVLARFVSVMFLRAFSSLMTVAVVLVTFVVVRARGAPDEQGKRKEPSGAKGARQAVQRCLHLF